VCGVYISANFEANGEKRTAPHVSDNLAQTTAWNRQLWFLSRVVKDFGEEEMKVRVASPWGYFKILTKSLVPKILPNRSEEKNWLYNLFIRNLNTLKKNIFWRSSYAFQQFSILMSNCTYIRSYLNFIPRKQLQIILNNFQLTWKNHFFDLFWRSDMAFN